MNLELSKTWYMQNHWICDQEALEKLWLYWYKVSNNDADYFTKDHPTLFCFRIIPRYARLKFFIQSRTQNNIPRIIRLYKGCVEPSTNHPLWEGVLSHGFSIPSQLQISDSVIIMIKIEYNRYRSLSALTFWSFFLLN